MGSALRAPPASIIAPGDNVTWIVALLRQNTTSFEYKKSPALSRRACFILKPGSDLLSHGNSHTIIGDALFHCCVRDGNRWFQSSMAARHNWVLTLRVSVFGKRSGNNARSIIKSSRSLMQHPNALGVIWSTLTGN